MNWMGGSLNRHAKQNRARHKFIKKGSQARRKTVAGALARPSQSPDDFHPNFLKDSDPVFASTGSSASSLAPKNRSRKAVQSSPRQIRLENYSSFTPIVSRLESLRQRVADSSSGHQAAAEQRHQEIADIINAHDEAIEPTTDGSKHGLDSVETKRRALLSHGDWAGLHYTAPVQMKFGKDTRPNFVRRRDYIAESKSKDSYAVERPSMISILPLETLDDGLHMTGALITPRDAVDEEPKHDRSGSPDLLSLSSDPLSINVSAMGAVYASPQGADEYHEQIPDTAINDANVASRSRHLVTRASSEHLLAEQILHDDTLGTRNTTKFDATRLLSDGEDDFWRF